jgi:hypothetical protein
MVKHVRVVSTVMVMLAFWLGSAAAQLEALQKTTPQQRAELQTAMMKERLSLTPEQLPKIEALNLKYAEQMQPIITGSEGPLMKKRAADKVDAAKEAELQQVLAPDQFQKYLAGKDEMRDKLRQRLMQKMGGGS